VSAFSKAGTQLGLKDAVHGKLFYDIIKILEVHRPELIILENIAHFVKHDEGNTYRQLQAELSELGYDVRVGKFSPHQFGVPQIRERMYLVARVGTLDGFEFPQKQTTAEQLSIKSILNENPSDARRLSGQVVECLELWQEFLNGFPHREELPGQPIWTMEFGATYPYDCESLHEIKLPKLRKYRGSFGQSLDGSCLEEVLERVPSHARSKVKTFPKWKQHFIQMNREFYLKHKGWLDAWLPKIQRFPSSYQKLEWHCKGEPRDIWNYVIRFRASGVRVKRPTTSPSLVAMTSVQVPIIGWEKRYMTVRECARLQSMDGLKQLPEGSHATKALGNAVNVHVVKLILQNLLVCRSTACLSKGVTKKPQKTGVRNTVGIRGATKSIR
jgi:DNA (cytosine-5)-methyltransferase 1